MTKLNIEQTTIFDLFSKKTTDFLIPDYQRPYEWDENKCETLWDDLLGFAFPKNNSEKFEDDNYYFLGSIVFFKNLNNKLEVIDGQQRLTTLMLLLRAFYKYLENITEINEELIDLKKDIARCIWFTDANKVIKFDKLKINSKVAFDSENEEFLSILRTGETTEEMKSRYKKNYVFFQNRIKHFISKFTSNIYFPRRIIDNCILLPIETDNQNTALKIFSTLNDRGMPLSDSDIFKAQLYNYYKDYKENANYFIENWQNLEKQTNSYNSSMNELFTRYMYFLRAKNNIKSSTTESLRDFYKGEDNSYEKLKNDNIIEDLKSLSLFWENIFLLLKNDKNLKETGFTEDIAKNLFILNFAPNGMWVYFVSVYYMQNKDIFNNESFLKFLDKTIAFILGYSFTNPGVNSLRTPIYSEMINIVNGKDVTFEEYKIDKNNLKTQYDLYYFSNQKSLTRSILVWWAFKGTNQKILSTKEEWHIEHIYSKQREKKENKLINKDNLESIGNKVIAESRVNISASDYRFSDKQRIYEEKKTEVKELIDFTDSTIWSDFTEKNIEERKEKIKNTFIKYLEDNGLLK